MGLQPEANPGRPLNFIGELRQVDISIGAATALRQPEGVEFDVQLVDDGEEAS